MHTHHAQAPQDSSEPFHQLTTAHPCIRHADSPYHASIVATIRGAKYGRALAAERKSLVAFNCDWGVPVISMAGHHGKCEGGWTSHREGFYGEIALDGLNFSVYVNWPGAITRGTARRSSSSMSERRAQRAAIEVLLGGKCGGH